MTITQPCLDLNAKEDIFSTYGVLLKVITEETVDISNKALSSKLKSFYIYRKVTVCLFSFQRLCQKSYLGIRRSVTEERTT